MNDALIDSMRGAVKAAPDNLPLRLRLAELLLAASRQDEAVDQLAAVIAAEPGNWRARALLSDAFAAYPPPRFDWTRAEADLAAPTPSDELPDITLADVGGLTEVKARLSAEFGMPRGGLLLYGPPGCGKSFLARAVAGQLGARFISTCLAGPRRESLRRVFALARGGGPSVLFLAEVDAIAPSWSTVDLLGAELDAGHENVLLLAASSAPWNVPPALRLPGRLDRALLVLPPDRDAREAILRHHLRDRRLGAIDLGTLAARTEGMTSGDLARVCEAAAERAMLNSAASGTVCEIEIRDLNAALAEIHPSARVWFDTARTQAGDWDELARYLRRTGL